MAKRKVFSISSSLSEGLEQTIASAHNYSSALRIDIVALTKIEVDPENPRSLTITPQDLINGFDISDPQYSVKTTEKESLESLAKSINEQGLLNPIVVYELNNRYRIIAGERRTLASILAGKSDIQAKIIDGKPNEYKIRLLQWIENMERSDLTLIERIDNLEKILNAYAIENSLQLADIRITDISNIIGCSKSHAINFKAVLNADSDIKQLIAENKIRNIEKAALLANVKNPDIRQKAIIDCLHGATLKQLKQYLDLDKHAPTDIYESKKSKQDQKYSPITFGNTLNLKVARTIFDSAFSILSSELKFDLNEFDLHDPHSLSKAFKLLVSRLEESHEKP